MLRRVFFFLGTMGRISRTDKFLREIKPETRPIITSNSKTCSGKGRFKTLFIQSSEHAAVGVPTSIKLDPNAGK